ncbi:MAG TPA: BatD family protein [bacterium]|nr:BatD family protein [bacterium]
MAACLAMAAAIWFGALGSSHIALAEPPVAVEAAPSVRSIAVGDTFRLDVKFDWPDGVDAKPLALPEKIGNFVVKDIANGPVSTSGGHSIRTSSLLLTVFETGTQTIPPISAVYVGADGTSGTVETQPVEIQVTSVLPEKVDDIRDIKRPIRVPRRWKDIILSYLVILGLAVAASASVLVSFKRREEIEAYLRRIWARVSRPVWNLVLRLLALVGLARKRVPAFDVEITEPGLLPAEAAVRELDKTQALGLVERGMVGELYRLVSETLRRYLERQFGVLAMESPTSYALEILLNRGLTGEAYRLVSEVLGECDLVKFAKYVPASGPAGSLIGRARNIVSLTAQLAAVPDSWFLAQSYAGADLRPRSGGAPAKPGGQATGERQP